MDEKEAEKTADSGQRAVDGESADNESRDSNSTCPNEGGVLGVEPLGRGVAQAAVGGEAAGDAGARGASPPPEEKTAELEARCSELEARNGELGEKCAELNDNYLRKAADFENFRKRTLEEKQKAIDFANQSLLLDIIPVLDDFERALAAASGAEKNEAGFDSLCDGIKMIAQRLSQTLENKWALKSFASKDAPFDPTRHEALMMEKSADAKEAVVMEEFAKGYTLKDRVVRTAKVKVLMPGD